MSKGSLIAVALLSAAAVLAPEPAAAQGKQTAMDIACVGGGMLGGLKTRIRDVAQQTRVQSFQEAASKAAGQVGAGPVCAAQSQEELLLLTGLLIDQAALTAAKGVDAAQLALGLQRPLRQEIDERERAATGFPTDPKATEALILRVSVESDTLRDELKERRKNHALDEQGLAKLAEARQSLAEVGYYAASAGAGGTLFGRWVSSGESLDALIATITSPKIGLGSDFAKALPARAKRVTSTIGDTSSLMKAISAIVGDPKEDTGEQGARKKTLDAAARLREALQSYSLTARQG